MNGKSLLLIGVLSLLLIIQIRLASTAWGIASGLIHGNDKNKTETVWHTERVAVDIPAYLTAKTSGGSITVDSHERDEIIIDISVRKNGRYLSKGEDAPVEIEITEDANGVEINSEVKRGTRLFRWNSGVSVSYRILVPRQTEVRAQTSGGSVSATNIDRQVSLITSGGPVTAVNVNGDVLARTSGGSITIKNISGDLTARSSGGGIRIEDAGGNLSARTSGGTIHLSDVSGNIEARTSGGSIHAGIVSLQDQLLLNTSGGSIYTRLPAGQGMDIRASGSHVDNRLGDFTGLTERGSVRGTVKDGGISVDIRTSGGTVRLEYADHITTDQILPVQEPF